MEEDDLSLLQLQELAFFIRRVGGALRRGQEVALFGDQALMRAGDYLQTPVGDTGGVQRCPHGDLRGNAEAPAAGSVLMPVDGDTLFGGLVEEHRPEDGDLFADDFGRQVAEQRVLNISPEQRVFLQILDLPVLQ